MSEPSSLSDLLKALKPKGLHMDIERRIKAREHEANARRRAYENEMRESDGESGTGGLIEQASG